MRKLTTILSGIAAGILFAGCGSGQKAADPNVIASPLDTCRVADKKRGSTGKPHTFGHEGREIKFCCVGCDDEFKTNTAKYIKKFDDAVASKKAAEAKPAEAASDTEKAG